MAKFADKYFKTEPWRIVEEGFDPAYAEVAESIFSLGNEYTGLRGYFEEGYSGNSLQGSYLNGIYEHRSVQKSGYKGMLSGTDFMVNAVDWAAVRIVCNGVVLDLAKTEPLQFLRTLDLRSGVLRRSFVWQVDEATRVALVFERFLSMVSPTLCGQRVSVSVQSGVAQLEILAGLDFSCLHVSTQQNHWNCAGQTADATSCEICGTTKTTGQRLHAAAVFSGMAGVPVVSEQFAGVQFCENLTQGEHATLTRMVCLNACKKPADTIAFEAAASSAFATLAATNYDTACAQSAAWWQHQWTVSDIEIEGDAENQQGIRYGMFQMHQTLHTAGQSAVIGAKGLTGEAYNGNAFWDSEVHCLPFYIFNNPTAAKNILLFRYDTLPQAKARAKALDCEGAFYPVATISGEECCDLWQHANLQLQASTGVAYGIWNYCHLTGDEAFLFDYGAEMLVEICRMLATRGAYSAKSGKYGFYCVMGPDEFQMMVNNNAYTNFMAQKTFDFAQSALQAMQQQRPEQFAALQQKLGFNETERSDWAQKSAAMYLPYSDETLLFEQNDGYFDLPHQEIADIPTEEFPLYSHWAYDRIYRNDMIKQPDVLMFMMMYPSDFADAQVAANYDFYEPRCIHESSLSPAVHSILACRLGRKDAAYGFFSFANRIDLDNYNRNSREGIHTTSIACSWLNIVYGFGGLCTDGAVLSLAPLVPAQWQSYRFCLQHDGCLIRVFADKTGTTLTAEGDHEITLLVHGNAVTLGKSPVFVALP